MNFLYEDSPREVVLESALHIGAAEGDEAITLESVAKLAELSVAKVRAEFPDREALVHALPDYVAERKAKFLEETLDAALGYADLFTKLTAFIEAYYEYAEREPELFRYLFEQKAYVSEEEWCALLRGDLSHNRTLDLIYKTVSLIATEEKIEVGSDVCFQSVAMLSVTALATVHGMAHLSVLGVLRHQHSVVRRFNLCVRRSSEPCSRRRSCWKCQACAARWRDIARCSPGLFQTAIFPWTSPRLRTCRSFLQSEPAWRLWSVPSSWPRGRGCSL